MLTFALFRAVGGHVYVFAKLLISEFDTQEIVMSRIANEIVQKITAMQKIKRRPALPLVMSPSA